MGKKDLGSTVLKERVDGEFRDVTLSDLWQDQPLVLFMLRRPGCEMCREQALLMWQARDRICSGGATLALVVHEWQVTQMEALVPKYWGGRAFHDPKKALFAACHNGKVSKGSPLKLLFPCTKASHNCRECHQRGVITEWNKEGNPKVLGGTIVFRRGGAQAFVHSEKHYGDVADIDAVAQAAQEASLLDLGAQQGGGAAHPADVLQDAQRQAEQAAADAKAAAPQDAMGGPGGQPDDLAGRGPAPTEAPDGALNGAAKAAADQARKGPEDAAALLAEAAQKATGGKGGSWGAK